MLAFVGDVHGRFADFARLFEVRPELMEAEAVLQLGDFGLWPHRAYTPPPRPVYWLDGNHEYFPMLRGLEEPTEVAENAIYLPRGTILDLDGRRIGVLGGADSPDRHTRVEGVDWFADETISYGDMMRFPPDAEVDLMAAHTPPIHIVRAMLGKETDPSAQAVEAVWNGLGRPRLFAGHMHVTRTYGQVELLGELDIALVG